MYKENDKISEIDLNESQKIGYGATSTVYLLPDGTVCKLFNPEFSFQEIKRESLMAESAFRLGIRVPKPYGMVRVGERVGIRSEYVAGESLAEIFSASPEKYDALLPEYTGELRHFHETKADSADFVSAKDTYLEKIEKLSGMSWYTDEELLKMKKLVCSVPDRDTLIFGDYHPKNIQVKENRFFFVDLGDTCIGHPVFDFAMIANTHFIIPSVNPVYAEKFFEINPQLMLRLWDDLFSLYFSDYSPEKQKAIKKGIMAFAVLRQGLSPADGRVFPEIVLKGNVAVTKRELLPEIDLITGSIDW